MYWDQPAYAQRAWSDEFLARYCPVPGVRIELRTGVPHQHVVAVASQSDADLIALGWSQQLDRGRAAVVRNTVAASQVPVSLLHPFRPVRMTLVPDGFAQLRVCWRCE